MFVLYLSLFIRLSTITGSKIMSNQRQTKYNIAFKSPVLHINIR